MEIAVIGAGNVGHTLGVAWAKRGRCIVCGVHDLSGTRGIVGSVLKAWLLASRVAVVLFGEVRVFHRPHPSPNTDKGAVTSIRHWLQQHGVVP